MVMGHISLEMQEISPQQSVLEHQVLLLDMEFLSLI
jgi:hypothetical protein